MQSHLLGFLSFRSTAHGTSRLAARASFEAFLTGTPDPQAAESFKKQPPGGRPDVDGAGRRLVNA